MLAPLAAVALCAATVSCSDRRREEPSLLLAVTGGDGSTPAEFVAVLTSSDGSVRTASCPAAPAPGTECRDDGLHVAAAGHAAGLTLKARGHAFVTTEVQVSSLPRVDGVARLDVALEALPPFEVTEDYATGLESEGAREAFGDLSVPMNTELGPAEVVKFYVAERGEAPRVFLQNTRLHPLHYDFAREVAGVAQGLAEFEAATYRGEERTGYAGTLTYYPELATESSVVAAPLTLSFFPSDDLTPTQALECHRLLEERLGLVALAGDDTRLAYLPAGDEAESALDHEAGSFASAGAAWLTRQELYGGLTQQLLNDGVAYGTLRRMTPEELAVTVVSYTDVLVLTRLPNELPVVGGTITEELQTPLAHVNVAARARGTPNLALLEAGTDPRIAPLLGEVVRFEVGGGSFRLEAASLAEAEAFWAARVPEAVVPAFDAARDGLPGFDALAFADSLSVGVKAANLAELHHLLPELSPEGFAVPFRYYDEHLRAGRVSAVSCAAAAEACVAEGRAAVSCAGAEALCSASPAEEDLWGYAERLLAVPDFVANSVLRDASLASLRHHVVSTPVATSFASALDARVTEVFGAAQIRLRSSTNSEDLPNFSGAGLYDSVSASGDKGLASDRIRSVWASAWGFRAFEERSFWGIDHLAVRMGVAVNPAFDDEGANGVLITQNLSEPTVAGMYVNVQAGEVSVTNPTDGSLPEIFAIVAAPTGLQVARQRFSSLSPSEPLLDDAEISALYLAADAVQGRFATLYGASPYDLALDLEFKLVGARRSLVLKQVRPYVR